MIEKEMSGGIEKGQDEALVALAHCRDVLRRVLRATAINDALAYEIGGTKMTVCEVLSDDLRNEAEKEVGK